MRRRWLPVLVTCLAACTVAAAAVEVVLRDGRVLAGDGLELRGDLFLLDQHGGTMALPVELVRELRFGSGPLDRTAEPTTGDSVVIGHVDEEVRPYRDLAEDPEDPDPRRPDGRSPSIREQLEVFGRPPAKFAEASVPTEWEYEDVLGYETDVSRFNPVRWYRPPTDPAWRPVSAFPRTGERPDWNPVRWYRPSHRTTWYPRDAFDSTDWFPPVVEPRGN